MKLQKDYIQKNKSQAIANRIPIVQKNKHSTLHFEDKRPQAVAINNLQNNSINSAKIRQLEALQERASQSKYFGTNHLIQRVQVQDSRNGAVFETNTMEDEEIVALALTFYQLHNMEELKKIQTAHPLLAISDFDLYLLSQPADYPVADNSSIQDKGSSTEEKKSKEKKKNLKRKRSDSMDNSDSEFSESDDDDTTTLDSEQKMRILAKKGDAKRQKLLDFTVDKSKSDLNLDDPRTRKVYAAHRSNASAESKLISNINKQESFFIGHQKLRLGHSTGHFLQAGGNARSGGIKEPSPDYHKFFPEIKRLGKDKNAKKMYQLATQKELGDKDHLNDAEVAAMLFYYMNNDVSQITQTLGERSQLTEHLSKFTAIATLSEFMRGMEAIEKVKKKAEGGSDEETPMNLKASFDATLLIKRGLQLVIKGEYTLQQVFYQGKGGDDSIFLGAPSESMTPSRIGGASYLRDPYNPQYRSHLDAQMGAFSDNKGAFKKELNALKTNSSAKLPMNSEEDTKKLTEKYEAEATENAKELLEKVKKITLPADLLTFLTVKSNRSPLYKFSMEEKKLRQSCGNGNNEALEILDLVLITLKGKRQAAEAKLGI